MLPLLRAVSARVALSLIGRIGRVYLTAAYSFSETHQSRRSARLACWRLSAALSSSPLPFPFAVRRRLLPASVHGTRPPPVTSPFACSLSEADGQPAAHCRENR